MLAFEKETAEVAGQPYTEIHEEANWLELSGSRDAPYNQIAAIRHIFYARTTRFTLFYGSPVAHRRSKSWDLLQRLKGMFHLSWCIFGDFNEITKRSEISRWNPSGHRVVWINSSQLFGQVAFLIWVTVVKLLPTLIEEHILTKVNVGSMESDPVLRS
ncbi:hypothetical protein QQ045_023875 [Rhodiola kirilowii]